MGAEEVVPGQLYFVGVVDVAVDHLQQSIVLIVWVFGE